MDRGLYIAATGMVAEQLRQDHLANDLANASTPGYKGDRVTQRSFADMLLVNLQTGAPVGPLGVGAVIQTTATDITPQPARETGEPLDFAIAGEGFFAIDTPQGVRYTRNGQFSLSPAGQLVDGLGRPVLSQGGAPIAAGPDGRVNPAAVGVFALDNPVKEGENLFAGAAGGVADGVVRAGALEGSGVDPARTMVDMIASMRAFEAGQRTIQAIDHSLGRSASQVGSLGRS